MELRLFCIKPSIVLQFKKKHLLLDLPTSQRCYIHLIATQSPTPRLFVEQFVQADNKENVKAPHYQPFVRKNPPLTGEFRSNRSAMRKAFPCHDYLCCYLLPCCFESYNIYDNKITVISDKIVLSTPAPHH